MAKKILIIQNISTEKPGLFGALLQEHGINSTLINLDQQGLLPPVNTVSDYGAVIVLGGPDSANDDTSKMKAERTFVQTVLTQQLPYLGICLGLQIGVKAAGGQVTQSPVKEIGWRDGHGQSFVVRTLQTDPLLDGLPSEFRVFQLHGETVKLTPEMQVLGTSTVVPNQLIKLGERAYGLQFHCELTDDMLEKWLQTDSDLKQLNSAELQAEFSKIKTEYTTIGRTLFQNFLKLAGY